MILILTDTHSSLHRQKEIFSAAISERPAPVFLLGDIAHQGYRSINEYFKKNTARKFTYTGTITPTEHTDIKKLF